MNILFLIPLVILLILCINAKYNFNINLRKYKLLLFSLLVMILIIIEIVIKSNKLEHYISYPVENNEIIPNQDLKRNKIFDANLLKKLEYIVYNDIEISNIIPFTVSAINQIVYVSGNVFNENSRFLSRYKLNKVISEKGEWMDPIEMEYLYQNKAVKMIEKDNSKYLCTNNVLNNMIFFGGGMNIEKNTYTDDVSIIDFDWNIWYNANFKSGEGRVEIATIIHNNIIYFAGGFKGGTGINGYSDKLDFYDYNKGHYTDVNAWGFDILPSGARTNIKVSKIGDKILFFSGFNGNLVNKIDIYDTKKKGYKWSIINIPENIIDNSLNVVSFNNKILMSKSLKYSHSIPQEFKLETYYNNNKIFRKSGKKWNKLFEIRDSTTYGLYGGAKLLGDWVSDLYGRHLNSYNDTISISLWLYINKLPTGFSWIIGKYKFYKSLPGLVIIDEKVYPIVNVDGNIYKYTNGIKISEKKWTNITISFNFKEISSVYVNYHSKLSFNPSYEITKNLVTKGISLDNNKKLIKPDVIKNFWVDAYITEIKFYQIQINDYISHSNYLYNLDRHNTPIDIETDTKENNKEINYYTKTYSESQMFIYDGRSITPYDPFFLLSRKLYYNLVGINCNNNYLVYTGNEANYYNKIFRFDTCFFVYNVLEDFWYIKKKNKKVLFLTGTWINNNVILAGLDKEDKIINVLKFEKPEKKIIEKPKIKKITCKPGQKKVKDKCIDCDINYFSNRENSLVCSKCPSHSYTNNKKGQTKCIHDDNFFTTPKKINISSNIEYEITDIVNKYKGQILKNKDHKLMLKAMNNNLKSDVKLYKKQIKDL